ncbi:MAG: MlaD family protein [Campylobacterota bacterium]|nr:MlaD family protein [Campylobacterota bacterium]
MQHSPIERKRSSSTVIVWIIPLLALMLAGWMLYKFYSERGTEIVITFKDGSGLLERKTLLKYKGIVVGHVTKIELHALDISKVDVSISVNSNAISAVAREGNEFWKVKPKVTLTEVSGLETIVGGLYIEIYPAKKTFEELYKLPKKYEFIAAEHKPFNQLNPGVQLLLKDKVGRFALDTPIIYRKFIVGHIVERELTQEGVEYIVHIEEKYKHLVKSDSRFWGISSVDFKASMAGIKLKVDSLATLIAGGITFNSNDSNESKACFKMDKIAEFDLYEDEEAIQFDQNIITLEGSRAYNIDPDLSAVYYKGVAAGKIEGIHYDPLHDSTYFKIRLKKSFSALIKDKGYFWIVEPKFNLNGISGLDAIAKGPYITFMPHKGEPNENDHFTLHVTPPKNDGTRITLMAKNIGALRVGSGLFYNDIETGYISDIKLAEDKKSLVLSAIIENRHKALFNDSSLFYLRNAVETDISLSQIKIKTGSLKSIIQGGIAFDTKNFDALKKKKTFKLHNDYLDIETTRYLNNGGKFLTLHAKAAASIKEGAPIYYNRFKAGEVLSLDYNESTDLIDIDIYVEKRFAHKINSSTRFYNAGGLDVSLDFPNLNVHMDSLQSLVSGAIAFITLNTLENNTSSQYTLYENRKIAQDQSYKATLTLDSGMNLRKGSKIIYKNIVIGNVSDVSLVKDQVEVLMSIDKAYKELMREDSLISLSKFELGLEGVKNAGAIISGPSLHVRLGRSEVLGKSFILKDIISHENQLREGLRIVLSADRRSSLKVGSPLLYRQVKIGDVEQFRLSDNATQVEFSLFIEPCYAHLVRQNSRFYNASALGVEIGLGGVKVKTETLETMMGGGIVLVTPTDYKDEAKTMQVFKLHNEPEGEWLNWHPRLSSSNAMCQ